MNPAAAKLPPTNSARRFIAGGSAWTADPVADDPVADDSAADDPAADDPAAEHGFGVPHGYVP